MVDPSRLNPELGTEEDYAALVVAIHGQGLGQVLDIVPNHMGHAPVENPYWTDVLENFNLARPIPAISTSVGIR